MNCTVLGVTGQQLYVNIIHFREVDNGPEWDHGTKWAHGDEWIYKDVLVQVVDELAV